MTSNQIMALDAMGGDFGPAVVVPAAALALKQNPDIRFLFYGDEKKIAPLLDQYPALKKVSEIHHTDDVISGDEKPSAALRTGKNSSMRLAIDAVKAGEASSVVSGGNTGALMAIAKIVLRTVPGVDRPAIASSLPTQDGSTIMLDLGANLICSAEHLVQFAILGAVYARTVNGVEKPTVGLLNIGSEDMKGHDQLRQAASILSEIDFPGDYTGFIEGDDIPKGKVDVVVTDGFTGNVALKVAEGVAEFSSHFMKEAFSSSLMAKIGALFAMSSLKKVKARMDHRRYNGGMFLGLNGICVKSHGSMDVFGFSQAILVAASLVEQGYNDRVSRRMKELSEQESFASVLKPQKTETS